MSDRVITRARARTHAHTCFAGSAPHEETSLSTPTATISSSTPSARPSRAIAGLAWLGRTARLADALTRLPRRSLAPSLARLPRKPSTALLASAHADFRSRGRLPRVRARDVLRGAVARKLLAMIFERTRDSHWVDPRVPRVKRVLRLHVDSVEGVEASRVDGAQDRWHHARRRGARDASAGRRDTSGGGTLYRRARPARRGALSPIRRNDAAAHARAAEAAVPEVAAAVPGSCCAAGAGRCAVQQQRQQRCHRAGWHDAHSWCGW